MMLCCFLLLTSAGIANSVRRDTIRGKAVKLFSNTDIGINNKEVILYINESTLIATWTWTNGPIEAANMNLDYMGRIDMDRIKNIWIFEVDVTDAGKYWIKCIGTDKVIEVELNILEKNLTEDEMKIWLDDHQGFIEKYLGNLTDEVGKEVSKWLEDHPGFFQKLFDDSGLELYFMITIFVIVTVLLVQPLSKLLAEVCTMLKSSRWIKCPKVFGSTLGEETLKARMTSKVLSGVSHIRCCGAFTGTGASKSTSMEFWSSSDENLIKQLSSETEEAITECQGSHNTKIMREKGPQADHCAYCGNRNNAMFVLPCEHEGTWYIPTCTKCGISPKPPCQKCRAPNRRYMEYALWKFV